MSARISLHNTLRASLVFGWLVAVASMIAASVALNANLSTTVLLLALGLAPGAMAMLMSRGAASATVAELLHSVDTKGRRR